MNGARDPGRGTAPVTIDGRTDAPPRPAVPSVTLIKPIRGWTGMDLRELWSHRELVWFLTWRDIKVRYKQTTLGILWAILQPLMAMALFSLFFGRLGRMPSEGLPYPLFALAALVPWMFFAHGVGQAANSVVGNQHLITKVYFPRIAIPTASVMSGALDFAVGLVLLAAMLAWYDIAPTIALVWIVPLCLLTFASALGVGLWLAALNVRYRDVRHMVPFLMQMWLFATPIVYPSSLLSAPWRTVYALNPMVGVVEGVRVALLGTGSAPPPVLLASTISALVLLVSGAIYFRRVEATFADIV